MRGQHKRAFVWTGICVLVWAVSVVNAQTEATIKVTPAGAPAIAEDTAEKATPEEVLGEIKRREQGEVERKETMDRLYLIRLRQGFQYSANERWQREALEKEADLFREGEEFFEDKEYRDAKARYLDVIEITYPQWVFSAESLEFIKNNRLWHEAEDFIPKFQKKHFALSTEFTRLTLVRLADIDTTIDEYELAELRIDADNASENGRLAEAYRVYGNAIEHARKMGKNSMAQKYIREIDVKRAAILETVRNPLEVAKTSLEANEPAAALAALEEFQANFSDFIALAEIKRAYMDIANRPEIKQQNLERAALQIVALGDAAVERKDYQRAVFWYRRAALKHANTRAGALAAEKREKLLADPEITKAIDLQEAEYVCKAMLARASTFTSWGKIDEAEAVYDEIVTKYPDTPWAKEAAEAKAKLAAPAPQ